VGFAKFLPVESMSMVYLMLAESVACCGYDQLNITTTALESDAAGAMFVEDAVRTGAIPFPKILRPSVLSHEAKREMPVMKRKNFNADFILIIFT